jgi:hypothetical protein
MVAFLLIFLTLGRLYREMWRRPESRGLLLMAGGLLLGGVLFYTRVEKWSVLDAVYFCVVTLATVGYGDITPTTDAGRIFTIFYIVVGLGIIGGFFATLGQLIQPGGLLRRGERGLAREFQVGPATSMGEDQGSSAAGGEPHE